MFVLSIDFGLKRIGLALGDQETKIAFPRKTILNNASGIRELVELIEEYNIKTIICGKPVQPNPIEKNLSYLEMSMNIFLDNIKLKTKVSKIIFIDETLTTAVSKNARDKDSASALLILEEYFANIVRYENNL